MAELRHQSELRTWQELPDGGVLSPGEAKQPLTGDWRTNGRPVLDLSRCINCLLCWLYCPDSAIELDGQKIAAIDYGHCKGCELCVEVCPQGALEMAPEEEEV